jgi:cobalt transporter subunit CbtA
MTKNLLTSAVFAGVVAGLIAALLHFYFVIPTLLEGELFETGARIHFGADGSPQSERGSPGMGGDIGRHLMTVGFNIVTYVGFGFLLLAAMAATELKGFTQITARSGIIWGLAGFIAIQMAPAIGLPPVLPGTISAEVEARQAWWLGTIVASGIGLWVIAFARGPFALAGVALLAAPQFGRRRCGLDLPWLLRRMVLDPRELGGNSSNKAKSQRTCWPRVHDLPIGTVGIKFGKGFDVFGRVGVNTGKQIRGLPLGAHRKADGFVAHVHAIRGFDVDASNQGFCQIRTA